MLTHLPGHISDVRITYLHPIACQLCSIGSILCNIDTFSDGSSGSSVASSCRSPFCSISAVSSKWSHSNNILEAVLWNLDHMNWACELHKHLTVAGMKGWCSFAPQTPGLFARHNLQCCYMYFHFHQHWACFQHAAIVSDVILPQIFDQLCCITNMWGVAIL